MIGSVNWYREAGVEVLCSRRVSRGGTVRTVSGLPTGYAIARDCGSEVEIIESGAALQDSDVLHLVRLHEDGLSVSLLFEFPVKRCSEKIARRAGKAGGRGRKKEA